MSTSPLPTTNDTTLLAPVTAIEGRQLTFDFPALHIGVAEYAFGFGRDNAIYPDKALGRAALKAAQPGRFPLGPRGAGCTANVGNGFTFDQSARRDKVARFARSGRRRWPSSPLSTPSEGYTIGRARSCAATGTAPPASGSPSPRISRRSSPVRRPRSPRLATRR
jgi:hypothetical protein